MVKQLLKYEFKARYRIPLLMALILLPVTGAVMLLSAFESDSIIYNMIHAMTVFLFISGCFALILTTVILNIVRFYRNLYSAEGYLSFTLPVSEGQHIFAKTLVSSVLTLGAILYSALCICLVVFVAGDLQLLVDDLHKAFKTLCEACGAVNVVFFVIEAVLVLIAATVYEVMKLQACLSIGQLARRRKILLSFGVYAGLYVLRQMVGTFFLVMNALFVRDGELFDRITRWFADNLTLGLHLVGCGTLFVLLVGTALYCLATYLPMKKKLNLE